MIQIICSLVWSSVMQRWWVSCFTTYSCTSLSFSFFLSRASTLPKKKKTCWFDDLKVRPACLRSSNFCVYSKRHATLTSCNIAHHRRLQCPSCLSVSGPVLRWGCYLSLCWGLTNNHAITCVFVRACERDFTVDSMKWDRDNTERIKKWAGREMVDVRFRGQHLKSLRH